MIVKKRSASKPSFSLLYPLKAAARQVEEFYSPGSLELLEARRRLAEFSLPRLGFRYYPAVMVNLERCLLLCYFFRLFLCAELKSESLSSG